MGTIAEKLTYLNTTKEKIRDSINLTGANIGTSDTFRSYASKLKKGYIDIINNGIDTLYNNFPKVSGIGSNLSLTPTYEAPMKLNEIQGDTLQENTPTPDSPVEIQNVTGLQNVEVCGKNLINSVVKSGNRLFFNGGTDAGAGTFKKGTYTISYTSQNTITTYIKNTDGTQTNLGTDKTITFTSNKDFDLWLYRSGITIEEVSNIQLEQGSTATTYEPYNGNTYEVNLGKNLVDFSNLQTNNNTTYTWQNDILEVKATTGTYNRVYIDITSLYKNNPGKTLRFDYETLDFSQGVSSSVNLQIVKSDTNTYVELVDNSGTIITRTIPNDTSEITQVLLRVVCNNTNTSQASQISITKPILHFGNIATTYAPYFTPIELNKIGDYQDSIKKSTGKNIITTYNYASSGYINYNYDNSKIGKTMTYSFIPNFSTTNASLYIRANTSISSYKVGTISTITSGTKVSVTFTLTDEQYDTIKNTTGGYIQVYKSGVSMDENSISNPMLEINSQSTSYEPYGKVWYVEKQIGKVILNGSEAWGYDSNSLFFVSSNAISNYSRSNNIPYCDYYKGVSNVNGGSNISNNQIALNTNTSNDRLYIKNSNITNQNDFTTWLSTHNTEIYYVLAAPTYTEITNTELIEDLETLYTAKSQEGTTNISITSEDLEMILNVSALKGE